MLNVIAMLCPVFPVRRNGGVMLPNDIPNAKQEKTLLCVYPSSPDRSSSWEEGIPNKMKSHAMIADKKKK